LVGDQISLIAIPLLAVLTIGAGAAEMGYLTAAALLPNLFLSLLAGAWVDQQAHKRKACSPPWSSARTTSPRTR
jgi:hypothetical protein